MEYNSPKTEHNFIELFNNISRTEFNWVCDVPVSINPKLCSTLGLYRYDRRTIKPLEFQFHIDLINGKEPLNEIINTIRHELVHWYTDTTTHRVNKHNDEFIRNCKIFGVTDYEIYLPRKKLSKNCYYESKCLGCDRVVAKCKSMSNLKIFMNRHGGTVCSCGFGKRYVMDKGTKYVYNHGEHLGMNEQWLDYDYFTKDLKIIFCKEERKD